MAQARDAEALDIKALLQVALDQRPRDDIAERVMDRVAAMDTMVELARLIGVAPLHWLIHAEDAARADRPADKGERDEAELESRSGRDPD